jgi:hypothetical protein
MASCQKWRPLSTTIIGLPSGPGQGQVPGMKSRHGYADKDKDLPSIRTSVGALRRSVIDSDGFSFDWPTWAGRWIKVNAAGMNVSSKVEMMFIALLN